MLTFDKYVLFATDSLIQYDLRRCLRCFYSKTKAEEREKSTNSFTLRQNAVFGASTIATRTVISLVRSYRCGQRLTGRPNIIGLGL